MNVLYLGISGVLHPSESLYELLRAARRGVTATRSTRRWGGLEQALEPWPSARIVLTSTQPWARGLGSVLTELGPTLAARVYGFTFEDLTTKAIREFTTRSGTVRRLTRSSEDYWRMNKSDIVAAHVEWLKPAQWIVLDDEDILWPADVRVKHVVLTDGCKGLLDPAAQDRLFTVLQENFS